MSAPIEAVPTSLEWWKVGLMIGVAFCGAFLRAGRWMAKDGSVIWTKLVFDLLGSPAIGAMAIGGSYLAWGDHVSPWVMGGVAGFMGMVGPTAIEATAGKFFGVSK